MFKRALKRALSDLYQYNSKSMHVLEPRGVRNFSVKTYSVTAGLHCTVDMQPLKIRETRHSEPGTGSLRHAEEDTRPLASS